MKIVIPYPPVAKKNNMVMVKSRNLLLPSKAFRKFHDFCIGTRTKPGWLLLKYGNINYTDPVEVWIDYYLATRRIPDCSNLVSATLDVLQAAGILEDDMLAWNINAQISGIDRKQPRTEIQIEVNIPEWWGK